jgi:GTPase SAR1 family protein
VYDVTDPKSLEELEYFIEKIEKIVNLPEIPKSLKFPCVIVGNKFDLKELQFVKKEEGIKFSNEKLNLKKYKLMETVFMEVSAKGLFFIYFIFRWHWDS